MLLGHFLLSGAERAAAAKVWLVRERTEHEAAALFDGLAADLDATGAPSELVELARRCADDERDHAERCWSVVRSLDPSAERLSPTLRSTLGPPGLSRQDRALYTSVAVGCVTESLSTALLIELQQVTTHPEARETLRAIVKDEVRHSRLGWAHLAHEAGRRSVAWLTPHVDAMIRSARAAETPEPGPDLRAYGILDGPTVAQICDATVDETIRAGFTLHGIA